MHIMEYLETGKFLRLDDDIPVIDVRSPAEFEAGRITGAHNIPPLMDLLHNACKTL